VYFKKIRRLSPSTLLIVLTILAISLFLVVGLLPSFLYRTLDIESYLVFHMIAEIFSVIVSFSIFGVGYFTYKQSKNSYALFLSCAFLAIGLIDLFHVLSFPQMPNFITPNNNDKSISFWIAARLISAVTLVISAYIYKNSANRWLEKKYLIPAALFTSAIYLFW